MIDNDLLQTLKSRRSVRNFDLSIDVPFDLIEKILEAAIWAPSACNGQGWHFIIVDNHQKLEELSRAGVEKVSQAPVAIFVFYRKYIRNKPINFYLSDSTQSASAAIQNMLLMADSLGLGACWTNGFSTPLEKVLPIPFGYEFVAMVRLGYPAFPQRHTMPRKFSLTAYYSRNTFHFPSKDLSPRSQIIREFIVHKIRKLYLYKTIKPYLPRCSWLKKKLVGKHDISSFKKN